MGRKYEVIVAGLGAMGSAALFHLARRGVRVLGLDAFAPPHERGSSHGQTRIIREAYFEDPIYVPLVQRAYELWGTLERESGEELYLRTGGVMIGGAESVLFSGAERSAREHHLPHEILDAKEISRRFPGLRPEAQMVGLLEPRAGILFPEKCIAAHLRLAEEAGAAMRLGEPVVEWTSEKGNVRVKTPAGVYEAEKMVFCAGAWMGRLLPDLGMELRLERQALLWFAAKRNPEQFAPGACPVHPWEYAPGQMFYGFPDLGSGIKFAIHHQGREATPEELEREAGPEDEECLRGLVERFASDAAGALVSSTLCLYTNTKDEHFLLDRHPRWENVIIGSPCSGHGFKFSSVIGEILADLATGRKGALDLRLFCLRR